MSDQGRFHALYPFRPRELKAFSGCLAFLAVKPCQRFGRHLWQKPLSYPWNFLNKNITNSYSAGIIIRNHTRAKCFPVVTYKLNKIISMFWFSTETSTFQWSFVFARKTLRPAAKMSRCASRSHLGKLFSDSSCLCPFFFFVVFFCNFWHLKISEKALMLLVTFDSAVSLMVKSWNNPYFLGVRVIHTASCVFYTSPISPIFSSMEGVELRTPGSSPLPGRWSWHHPLDFFLKPHQKKQRQQHNQ